MTIDLYQVDAFSNRIFTGNPAAVCPLDDWLPEETMQQIAAENNLSETAFFVETGNDDIGLRWFTPKTEVNLCGHATLATAHVLFTYLGYEPSTIKFSTRSGELTVTQQNDGWYAMNFPAKLPTFEKVPEPLKRGMGNMRFKECYKADDYMLIVGNEEQIWNIDPDFRLLSEVETRGIIVTALGDEVDFVSRFFAPATGIDEDPVTGSAHTMLTPYWAERLDKVEMNARQISTRGGELKCKLMDDRVEISGQARTFMIGSINIENN